MIMIVVNPARWSFWERAPAIHLSTPGLGLLQLPILKTSGVQYNNLEELSMSTTLLYFPAPSYIYHPPVLTPNLLSPE